MVWRQRKPSIPFEQTDSIITKLAHINGITDIDEYLNPSEKSINDPYLIGNIQEAANEILIAISKKKRIAVSFDVDADGLTAGTIMYRFLKQFTDNVYYTFAERSEGHGIETQLKKIEDGTDLVIICDSSTNSASACQELEQKNMKLVILDHHIKEEDNPHALIVNPQMDDSPNKELSGAGVVYKTIQVMDDSLNSNTADNYLDLVAVGMAADMMSVKVPENRYLIAQGLRNIQNPGLEAILRVRKRDKKKADSQTIGFTIGPMLNGAARMDRLELAIQLLLEDAPRKCTKLANEIKELNGQRQRLEVELFNQVKPSINEDDKVIVVIGEGIEKGFNGLIATKIANAYKRPVIVVQEDKDEDDEEEVRLSGSYRTYGSFDMKGFLEKFHISNFVRGHAGAGGYSFKKKHLNKLIKLMNTELNDAEFDTELEYDLELSAKEIDLHVANSVQKFNWITGKDVPTAKVLIKNLMVVDEPDIIGENKDTIKVPCSNGIVLMKFRTPESEAFKATMGALDRVDVVGIMNVNEFFNWGKKELQITKQLIIEDINVQ